MGGLGLKLGAKKRLTIYPWVDSQVTGMLYYFSIVINGTQLWRVVNIKLLMSNTPRLHVHHKRSHDHHTSNRDQVIRISNMNMCQ